MIKLTVDEFRDYNIYDIYLTHDNVCLTFKQGLRFNEIVPVIQSYMKEYNLPDDSMITTNVYGEDEFLQTSITEPAVNYLTGNLY